MSRWLGWVPRALGHPLNTLAGFALLAYLVVLPLAGVAVSTDSELIFGNLTNVVSYVGASIAAGASVVNLHEHRAHRAHLADRLAAIHAHLTDAPRGDEPERTAP